MHGALRKAIETEALKDAGDGLKGIVPRLEAIDDKLDRVLALLEQPRPASVPPKGGR